MVFVSFRILARRILAHTDKLAVYQALDSELIQVSSERSIQEKPNEG